MHTPCLNAFWHSDPYIFLDFVGNVFFCLVHIHVDCQEVMSRRKAAKEQLHVVTSKRKPRCQGNYKTTKYGTYCEAALYTGNDYNTVNYDRSGVICFPIGCTCML